MSFLAKQPQLPQSTAAADPKYNSGYKAAEIIPLGWGRDLFPSKWISNKYDEHTQRAGSQKPDWQYCSIAAAYRKGPIDYVGKVYRDGAELANWDYTFSEGEESHTFTLNPSLASGRAWQAVVHRGTLDASASGVTNLRAKTGQEHPPYRGVAWIEWLNIDLGAGTTALPQLTVEMGMHGPLIAGYPSFSSHPYGVNPIAAIYALLTHAAGGDFDAALLDSTHWGDQAQALQDNGVGGRTGNLVQCHPNFTSSTSLGDAISQILAYFDGYIFAKDGQLRVGWFPSAAVDAGTLPEITEHDLESKPSGGGFPDWNEGATSAVVVFRNFDREYGEDAARYNAPANRENNVSADPVRKERPWVHASDQAAIIAAESATDPNSADSTTNLTVLKSRAKSGGVPLFPGDLLNWDYGPHSLDLVCRIVSRRLRMGSASDILTIARERGAYPRPYVAPVDERVLPADDDPGEIDTDDVRLWFLPSGLSDGREVAALIDRTKRTIYRADLHLSADGSAPWENILDSRFFAAKCTVGGSGINDTDTTLRIVSTSVDFARMQAQSTIEQVNDTLLLLVGDELVSVGDITVVSSNTYDLTLLRGRRGTEAAAHATSDVGWVFYRADIDSVEHREFYNVRDGSDVYDSAIATKHFKIQLYTLALDGLAKPDDPGISFTLPDLAGDATVINGYTILLNKYVHTVACDQAGTPLSGELGAGSQAKASVTVIQGNTLLTAVASSPTDGQFAISLGTLTNTTATKDTNSSVRCDTLTADTGTIAIIVNIAGAFTITKVFTLTKVKSATVQLVRVTATAQVFLKAAGSTSYSPSSITLTATAQGFTTPSYQWQYFNGSTWTTSGLPGTLTNSTYAPASGDFSGARTYRCAVTEGAVTVTDQITLYHIDDAVGYTCILTNEFHGVACNSGGTPNAGELGAGSQAFTDVIVFRGTTQLSATASSSPGANQFYITQATSGFTKVDSDTVRCDTMSSTTVSCSITIVVENSLQTFTKVFTLTKVLAGTNGTNGTNGLNGLDGSKTFYTSTSSPPSGTINTGDLWFVTDLAYELRRWNGSSWVKTMDASSTFEIISGTTYIKKAAIREVDAGVILAGTITAALTITSPTINGGTISIGSGSANCSITSSQFTYGSRFKLYNISSSIAWMTFNPSETTDKQIALYGSSSGAAILFGPDAQAIDVHNGFVYNTGDAKFKSIVVGLNGDINLYRDSANVLRSDDTFWPAALKSTYLEAGITTAVDVKDVNFRVYSGATQNARIDYTNGRYYVQGTAVLNTRYTGAPADATDLSSVITLANFLKAAGVNHGLIS